MKKISKIFVALVIILIFAAPKLVTATQSHSQPATTTENSSKIHLANTENLEKTHEKLPRNSSWHDFLLVLFGGLLASLSGIFVPLIANKLFYDPKIKLELRKSEDEYFVPEKDHEETAIYCHLTCIKIKGRRPAKRISALLTDVYKKDKHNKFTSKFVGGPIPLHRQYECVNNEYFCAFPTLRGDGIVFDLARLSRTKKGSNSKLELELRTHVNLPRTIFKLQEQGEIIATVMAVSDETVSKKQHIKIRWNGEWPESEDNIQNCLKFEEISDETLEKLKTNAQQTYRADR